MISATLISETNLITIFKTKVGLVLDVPCSLLGPMSPWDMGSGSTVTYQKHARRYSRVYSPEDFLCHSTSSYVPFAFQGHKPIRAQNFFAFRMPSSHNEVLVMGSHNKYRTTVKGILLNCDYDDVDLHNGTIKKYDQINEEMLRRCLATYNAKDQILPLLLNLNGKYDFYLKRGLKY